MNKRIVSLLLAGMLTLTGCASGSSEEREPQQTVVVYQALPLPDLHINVPDGFEETSSRFYDKFYIQNDATIIITEDKDAGVKSARDFCVDALTKYEKMTKSLDVLGDSVVYADNLAVQILEFTYIVEEGDDPMTCMTGYLGTDGTMYIVTCKCKAENYEAHRSEFLAVMQSIKPDREWIGAAQRAGEE